MINKFDKGIFKIYDKFQGHRPLINVIFILVDGLLLFYYFAFIPSPVWSSPLLNNDSVWIKLYTTINPFTTAAYIFAILALFHYIIFDSIVVKTLISIFHGLIILTSLILVMGMTKVWELIIYLPHVLAIFFCIVVSYRKWKRKNAKTGVKLDSQHNSGKKMKKIISSILLIVLLLLLWNCAAKTGLPENPIVFYTKEYEDYRSITWQEKEYLPFSFIESSDVGECIGYFEESGITIYVCELKGQSKEEWVATTTNLDNRNEAMAFVFREKDTSAIPEGMESETDFYWNY